MAPRGGRQWGREGADHVSGIEKIITPHFLEVDTPKKLAQAAAKWLETRRNSVIVTELATHGEEPDAIGWRGRHSTLIECKTTAADVRADAKKLILKRAENGSGQQRTSQLQHHLRAGWAKPTDAESEKPEGAVHQSLPPQD